MSFSTETKGVMPTPAATHIATLLTLTPSIGLENGPSIRILKHNIYILLEPYLKHTYLLTAHDFKKNSIYMTL